MLPGWDIVPQWATGSWCLFTVRVAFRCQHGWQASCSIEGMQQSPAEFRDRSASPSGQKASQSSGPVSDRAFRAFGDEPMPAPAGATPARERGHTFIDDEVVSIIARTAAENVPGVHAIGESTLRSSIWGLTSRHHGVDAEVGMKEAAIDVEIVVEFGYPLREVASQLREKIVDAVEHLAGRNVVEVNIFVVDIHVEKTQRRRRRELA